MVRGVVLSGSARLHCPAPYGWPAAVLAATGPRPDVDVPPQAPAWLAPDPGVPRERYPPDALLRPAVTTVRALVGGRPSVLVVEDLHALDPASLALTAAVHVSNVLRRTGADSRTEAALRAVRRAPTG